jgi:hypothetical protein
MIKVTNLLKNGEGNIVRQTSIKNNRGRQAVSDVIIYNSIPVRIEFVQLEAPIVISGRQYSSYYLAHFWNNNSGVLYDIKVGDFFDQAVRNKRYQIIEIAQGTLMKNNRYKLECKMEVLGDIRHDNFEKQF